MSQEVIKNNGIENTFTPSLIDDCSPSIAKFNRKYLRMSSISVNQRVVNLYIPYKIILGQEI